jgi:hypothetical protein
MRILALIALVAVSAGCSRSDLFRLYEYEEEVYLDLDGTATVYVNASIPALAALRGAPFDPAPNARFDRAAVRAFFTTPVTRVVRVSSTRRSNRRFAHVRIEVDDVNRLAEAAPFAWSTYRFATEADHFVYRQAVGGVAAKEIGPINWTGQEMIAFRLHLPSTILDHNAGEENHRRGNILVWEQRLADRLHGRPMELLARIETESILAHTLWLFIGTIGGVVLAFAIVVWLIARRGSPNSVHARSA